MMRLSPAHSGVRDECPRRVGFLARTTARTIAAVALATGVIVGAAGGRAVGAQEPTDPRTVVVRSLRLDGGETLTVALHPNATAIELRASAGSRLEACPGLLDGGAAVPGNSSWPSFAAFSECLPLADDGSVTLPSTVSDMFHLAFVVRARGDKRTKVPRLAITYVRGDGYFEIIPPPIAPGARGPRVSVRPASATTVGVQAYGIGYEGSPKVALDVRQRNRFVHRTSEPPPGGDAEAYGPVRLGSKVHVTPRNRGTRAAAVRIAIAWE